MHRAGLSSVLMRSLTLTLLPIAALWLASTVTHAGPVYKWVDEKGVTHYSDQPHPKATEVPVESAQTYSSQPAAKPATPAAATANAGPPYGTCEIYRPEKDEVFQNTTTVTAKLRLEPDLRPGDRVAIAVDGLRQMNQPERATEFVISDISRGTHSLMVIVEDRQGKAVCTAPTVQFHVRLPSKQSPVPSGRPRF